MEFENDFSLKEWAKDKPLSILQLDPADRAVLRIAATQLLEPSDWLSEVLNPEALHTNSHVNPEELQSSTCIDEEKIPLAQTNAQEGSNTLDVLQPQEDTADINMLNADALEILGEDPSATEKRGKDILQELACRLQHAATEGLSKETRKELSTKYLIPANCLHINAPKINPEIKVAIPEAIAKRDKGVKGKQKQMACAISCLGDIITTQINSKDKNKEMLQKLMDLARLLCDIQHSDSMTRRNFVLFALKKDLKEHLSNTKIDSLLFSESLSDTLKSAKTINKSGIELKADLATKNTAKRPKPPTSKNLNRKAPGPVYRPPAPPVRSYEPAAYRARPPPPPPPARSLNTWSRQPAATAVQLRRR